MSLFQSEAENLRKERDMLKMVEIRLTQEKEMFQAQQLGQNMLLTNLKSIQVTSAFMNLLKLWYRPWMMNELVIDVNDFCRQL